MRSVSEEPAPHPLPTPLGEDDGGEYEENDSKLERDMLLASKSKKSRRRLPLPAPHVLAVNLLSNRTLKLIRNMIKAELVTAY
jgi:hypothetical protein